MRIITLLFIGLLLACSDDKTPVDLIITNAKVYTVDEQFSLAESIAVKEGEIVDVGTTDDLLSRFTSENIVEAEGNTLLPGLIDAHAHLYNLGVTLQQVDLVGAQSKVEALERVVAFQNEKKTNFILGRGWDQNDWEVKEFPTKTELDSLFPDIPVALTRIDGHAYWVNSKVLNLAGINSDTKVPGGEVVLKDGAPSGVLVDAPMDLVDKIVPKPDLNFAIAALKDAEKICVGLGLTTVNDAGLNAGVIELIDSLQQQGELKIRVYAMVSNTPENLDHFLPNGPYETERLNVRSVKVYADGALGSRGAALKAPYSDQEGHFGAMITEESQLKSLAKRIAEAGFQMNTHAIGDSANIAVLRAYKEVLTEVDDPRWKVEHAQVIGVTDFDYFSNKILPSVQPTHATSDMYWAEDRVGPDRIKGAYSYKTLLNQAGMVALGTDFPVERVNPMHTFYAAVARKDLSHYPEDGYRIEEGLTREETLKGMTIWAAYSNFEEAEKGSLEPGKLADFVILDQDPMTCKENEIPNIQVLSTYINGELVFKKE